MKQQIRLFAVGFSLVAALSGCGDNIGKPVEALSVNGVNPQDPSAAFEKPFETLGATDEAAGFGDVDMGLLEEEGVTLEKAGDSLVLQLPLLLDGTATPTPIDLNCLENDAIFLKMRWGQLDVRERIATGTDPTLVAPQLQWINWSGSLTASAGRLSLVRTIAFEKEGEYADSIVEETDPKVIEFISHTKPHFDGLIVKYQRCRRIIDTVDPTVVPVDDATITFAAKDAPFSKTWTVTDLVKLHETYPVENANKDAFQIAALHRVDLCRYGKGTMHGMWFKVNERFGQIKGRVASSDGMPVGHIKGFYSAADADGVHKIVGKLVSKHGGFLGMVIGKGKDGKFEADIFKSRDDMEKGVKIGMITGRYEEGLLPHEGNHGDRRHKGKFFGIYELRELCDLKDPVKDREPIALAPVPVAPVAVAP